MSDHNRACINRRSNTCSNTNTKIRSLIFCVGWWSQDIQDGGSQTSIVSLAKFKFCYFRFRLSSLAWTDLMLILGALETLAH